MHPARCWVAPGPVRRPRFPPRRARHPHRHGGSRNQSPSRVRLRVRGQGQLVLGVCRCSPSHGLLKGALLGVPDNAFQTASPSTASVPKLRANASIDVRKVSTDVRKVSPRPSTLPYRLSTPMVTVVHDLPPVLRIESAAIHALDRAPPGNSPARRYRRCLSRRGIAATAWADGALGLPCDCRCHRTQSHRTACLIISALGEISRVEPTDVRAQPPRPQSMEAGFLNWQ